jgi:hypothetical protein
MKRQGDFRQANRKFLSLSVLFILVVINPFSSHAQVVVDKKNVNEDKDIQYIQFMYYFDKSRVHPVYFIDFGSVEAHESAEKNQKITIDGTAINEKMTPVMVMNKLYEAGWEYTGDALYVPVPLVENWQVYTFKRRNNP